MAQPPPPPIQPVAPVIYYRMHEVRDAINYRNAMDIAINRWFRCRAREYKAIQAGIRRLTEKLANPGVQLTPAEARSLEELRRMRVEWRADRRTAISEEAWVPIPILH